MKLKTTLLAAVVLIAVGTLLLIFTNPSPEADDIITLEQIYTGDLPEGVEVSDCKVTCPTIRNEYECQHIPVLTKGQIDVMKADNCQTTFTITNVNEKTYRVEKQG